MTLPQQIKAARMSNATAASAIDDRVGDLEKALADIFGFTLDSDVTESPTGFDNAGRFTKALLRHAAAAPVGQRVRDTTSGKEFRLVNDQQGGAAAICLDENTGSEGTPTWTRRIAWRLSDGSLLVGGSGGAALLFAQIVDSNAVTNTTTETAFNKSYTIPGNTLAVGDRVRIRATFKITAFNVGTLNLKVRIGGASGPFWYVQALNGAFSFFGVEFDAYVRAIGASGSVWSNGALLGGGPLFQGSAWGGIGATSGPVTLDTTAGLVCEATAQWGTADAGNSVKMVAFTVERVTALSTA